MQQVPRPLRAQRSILSLVGDTQEFVEKIDKERIRE